MLRKFFDANRRICDRIEAALPESFTLNYNRLFTDIVADRINRRSNMLVVDIGAGKTCHFIGKLKREMNPVLVGIDVSEDEIRENRDLSLRLVGDVSQYPVFRDNSIDAMVSRSVIEHLRDNASFIAHAGRALRSGGYFIHLFPGRYAPFAILNRMLPDSIARALLYFFYPEFREPCGFKAYYNLCYYSAFKKTLLEQGFEVDEFHLRYYQSLYFKFFLPFYLISLAYDLIAWKIGIQNMASQLLVVAVKR